MTRRGRERVPACSDLSRWCCGFGLAHFLSFFSFLLLLLFVLRAQFLLVDFMAKLKMRLLLAAMSSAICALLLFSIPTGKTWKQAAGGGRMGFGKCRGHG